MDVVTGYLLVSDITGYTRFLVESELAHAKEILDTLLKTTIAAIYPPIRLLSTRGDSVVAFVDDSDFVQPQALLEAIRDMYFDFRKQLELSVDLPGARSRTWQSSLESLFPPDRA